MIMAIKNKNALWALLNALLLGFFIIQYVFYGMTLYVSCLGVVVFVSITIYSYLKWQKNHN